MKLKYYKYYPLTVHLNEQNSTNLPVRSVSVGSYSIPVSGIDFKESVDVLDKLVGTLLVRYDVITEYDDSGAILDEITTTHDGTDPDPIASTLYNGLKEFRGLGHSGNRFSYPPVSVKIGDNDTPMSWEQETLMNYDVNSIIFYKDTANASYDGIYIVLAYNTDANGIVTTKGISKFGSLTVNINNGV